MHSKESESEEKEKASKQEMQIAEGGGLGTEIGSLWACDSIGLSSLSPAAAATNMRVICQFTAVRTRAWLDE